MADNKHANWAPGQWPPDEIPAIQLSRNEVANRDYRHMREKQNAEARDIRLPNPKDKKPRTPSTVYPDINKTLREINDVLMRRK